MVVQIVLRALSSTPFKDYRVWWSLSESKYAGTAVFVKKKFEPKKVSFNLDRTCKFDFKRLSNCLPCYTGFLNVPCFTKQSCSSCSNFCDCVIGSDLVSFVGYLSYDGPSLNLVRGCVIGSSFISLRPKKVVISPVVRVYITKAVTLSFWGELIRELGRSSLLGTVLLLTSRLQFRWKWAKSRKTLEAVVVCSQAIYQSGGDVMWVYLYIRGGIWWPFCLQL
jgi:hypothetical protein